MTQVTGILLEWMKKNEKTKERMCSHMTYVRGE